MEKKKLLLVAVSVGVVMLIIIGIPLMMISSRQNYAGPVNNDREWVTTVEPRDFPAQHFNAEPPHEFAEPQPPVSAAPPEDAYNHQQEEVIHVTTITVPIPETAAVPHAPPEPAPKTVTTIQPAGTAAAPVAAVKPAPATKPAPAPVAKAAPASQPAAKPAPAKTYNNYWVQTGAFSTKIRAEAVKESLADKGIASIIDNRDIDGKTWYRVRVGPYISETEAKYWLALVKSIDGFADSQIRLTQAAR